MSEGKYIIRGGMPIYGTVKCMGAKNLATKTMVAAMLGGSPSCLINVPQIGDVDITEHLIQSAGVKTIRNADSIVIDPTFISKPSVFFPDSRSNRIPILILSALLHRFSEVTVPAVGGDNIGNRKIDFHCDAIKLFGADIKVQDGFYLASRRSKLKGCDIALPYPSVGATETCLFLGVMAEGQTVIENAAIEPEIIELITMLNLMGGIITRRGDRKIVINGVKSLQGTNFRIMGDRIEAVSWASLAGASNGNIRVCGIDPRTLYNFLPYYNMAGGGYRIINHDEIEFFRATEVMSAVQFETDVYPGFSTDWQQPFATMLTQAQGISKVHETVHDNRFEYLSVLEDLGASVSTGQKCIIQKCRYHGRGYNHSATIHGATKLMGDGKVITVPDLRAGLAYVIAAAISEGTIVLNDIYHIERGYGDLISKLSGTNLSIRRVCQ